MKLSGWIAQRSVTFIFNKFRVVYIRWNFQNVFCNIAKNAAIRILLGKYPVIGDNTG